MLPWIFKKALERDAKFNDAGRNEDFAPVFNVGVFDVDHQWFGGRVALRGGEKSPCKFRASLGML